MLTLTFTRKPDGSSVLECTRADGSRTWERRAQPFYAFHDLTHWAVESVLGTQWGFYGFLAAGWNITDFGTRPLPPEGEAEALFVECIVGLLDQERGTGIALDAATFDDALGQMLVEVGQPVRVLATGELARIRALREAVYARWAATGAGETLELRFAG